MMAEAVPSDTAHAQKICELCNENGSKYCCPRCNILYCSLDCYKSEKHSGCSEDFYREAVTEELTSFHADDDSKRRMMVILEKMQAEGLDITGMTDDVDVSNMPDDVDVSDIMPDDVDVSDMPDDPEEVDSDDEVRNSLAERLRGLNMDNADAIWDAMTTDERYEFEAMVNRGEIGAIMPQWKPWWMYRRDKKLVEEVKKNKKDAKVMRQCPMVKKNIPEMSTLTSAQPSETLRYNIINILSAYAFTMRYFNGDVDAMEWIIYFLNICANLDTNTNFVETPLAVESVAQKCLLSQIIKTDKESLIVMRSDTFRILRGPSEENSKFYIKSALSHLYRILTEARHVVKTNPTIPKPETPKDKTPKEKSTKDKTFSKKFPEPNPQVLLQLNSNKVKKCLKKVEFYLSYTEYCSMELND